MSYWSAPPTAPRRNRVLSAEVIAVAAVQLLDAGVPDTLTLRTLAGALGVTQASLYGHVRGREDVLDLALDHVLGSDAHVQGEHTDLTGLLLSWHEHLLRHPWAIGHVVRRTPIGPGYLGLSERLCAFLAAEGVPDAELLELSYAVSNFVLGCALAQTTADTGVNQWRAGQSLDGFPHLNRAVLAHRPRWEEVVRRGVARLVTLPG